MTTLNFSPAQVKAVLTVLNNMNTCITNRDTFIPGVGDCCNRDENYKSPFNLTKSFSVCWHVYAHTPGDLGIGCDFLRPVFAELGYSNVAYPVESTVNPEGTDADHDHYKYNVNPYNLYWGTSRDGAEHKDCAVRRQLVLDLIEYFNKQI